MNPVAVLGAVFSGVGAAVIWTLIGFFTGYELPPFVALLVGGIVGFGAVSFDGHGVRMAFCAAAICLVSVFGGKVGGVYIAVKEARDDLAAQLDGYRYDAMNVQAASLCTLPSSEYFKDFMVDNGYAGEGAATDEDLERFTAVEVPVLRRLYAEKIDIGTWRELYAEKYLDYNMSGHSVVSLVAAEYGLVDLIFAALSVSVAFGMVTNATVARNARESRGVSDYWTPSRMP